MLFRTGLCEAFIDNTILYFPKTVLSQIDHHMKEAIAILLATVD
jgi:hypothetical protein